jgi:anti-sigma factor RsiW
MKCKEIDDLLDLYADRELSEEARARVDRHLMSCAACAYRIRSIEQTRSLLRNAYPAEESAPAFRERMEARLESALADVLKPESAEIVKQWPLPNLD